MPEVEIREKRREVVVVGTIKGTIENARFPNSSKWVFTDKEGKEYKVNPKSLDYFRAIKPGVAVELVFSEADYGRGLTEFLSSATAIEKAIPEQTSDAQFEDMKRTQEIKGNIPQPSIKPVPVSMDKEDWAEKDRITRKSIERQKSLEMAIEITRLDGERDPLHIIGIAKIFEAYLDGGAVKKPVNKVVEVARALGAEEIPF